MSSCPERYDDIRAEHVRISEESVPQPTTRVLALLELLQARPGLRGAELADRLTVDERTVRRYVAALVELGIPVRADRGRYGGYRLHPGFKLPPLMLTDDEAVVVALGLVAARPLGLYTPAQPVGGASTEIPRVLPDGLRRQGAAREATLGFTTPPTAGAPAAVRLDAEVLCDPGRG